MQNGLAPTDVARGRLQSAVTTATSHIKVAAAIRPPMSSPRTTRPPYSPFTTPPAVRHAPPLRAALQPLAAHTERPLAPCIAIPASVSIAEQESIRPRCGHSFCPHCGRSRP